MCALWFLFFRFSETGSQVAHYVAEDDLELHKRVSVHKYMCVVMCADARVYRVM